MTDTIKQDESATQGIAERLAHAIKTASNDDMTAAGTDKRRRHAERVLTMSDTIDLIDELVEALEPFAALADIINENVPDHYGLWSGGSPNTGQTTITVGHARAARTAIAKARGEADTTEGS